jgi:hypothetical protein
MNLSLLGRTQILASLHVVQNNSEFYQMGIAALAALTKIISRLGPMQILASLNAVNFKQEVPQMGFLAIALLTLLDSQMGLVVAATRITILSKLDQMPKLVSRSVMKVSTEIMMESAIVKKPTIQFN